MFLKSTLCLQKFVEISRIKLALRLRFLMDDFLVVQSDSAKPGSVEQFLSFNFSFFF